jgi:Ca2+-binding RTX toxin-like protein
MALSTKGDIFSMRMFKTALSLALGLTVVGVAATPTYAQGGPTCFGLPANAQVGNGQANVIIGTANPEQIRGRGSHDRLCGLGGNDSILGDGGNDQIDGGDGDDNLDGGFGNDLIIGGAGRDQIRGGWGNDSIQAADGAIDTIDCGLGAQDSVDADDDDIIAPNCENITLH